LSIDLTTAQTNLNAWIAADAALATSQSYRIEVDGSTRMLTRADGKVIAERIAYWRREVQRLSAPTRRRMRTIVN